MFQQPDIIVFSHLRWNFVYQRPQHLLSRLAANHRIIFIEEPVFDKSVKPYWECIHPQPNVAVYCPHTPSYMPGFSDEQIAYLQDLLRTLLENENSTHYIIWFYTPMALPLIGQLQPQAVIYDCMDELSAFLNAPSQMLQREECLLKLADVIFTGGPSLYRAKQNRHPNIHCFPSSVDAKHFAVALDNSKEALDQTLLLHPRFGFFGVIDERIDLPLLEAIADIHPQWQIALVGPVVKIDPSTLPQRNNIHYFGQRRYTELPSYLAGWDVCILPFARNEATRFISPTKTLEYMAAEKMIVSTPIRDIAELYSDIVYLGGTIPSFIAACEKALAANEREKSACIARMQAVLSQTSWDSTAQAMEDLIARAVAKRQTACTGETVMARQIQQKHNVATMYTPKLTTIVIGAGPTGLSAAYHLGQDAVLLEQNSIVGGWCRSIEENGFTYDYAGHIMFSNEPYVHQLYQLLLGNNVHWQDREAWIYSKNVYTRYPFQGALYGLPPKVIKECIVGAIEARFGSLKEEIKNRGVHASNGCAIEHPNGGVDNKNSPNYPLNPIQDCCADGILESTGKLSQPQTAEDSSGKPRNFEEFIYKIWGAGIAEHFAIPYNKKLWAVPLSEMETSWLGGRVPLPDLEEMIEGALSPVPKPMGPNARFGYPLRGGFQALMDSFLPHLKGRLYLNTQVAAVSPKRHTITLSNGKKMSYEYLISTIPLPILIHSMGNEAPANIRAAADNLRHVSVRCVHIGVGRENLTEKHWIYYPEDTVFHRIFVQGNASPYCNPPGGFGLTCEITYSEHKPLPCDGNALIQRCIEDCHKVGFFNPGDPIWVAFQVDMPYAYVIYDHGRKQHVDDIREWLMRYEIILAGRYSEWEYYNSDHAFLAGKRAADKVRELQEEQTASKLMPQIW